MGASCSATVYFQPTAATATGPKSATLVVTDASGADAAGLYGFAFDGVVIRVTKQGNASNQRRRTWSPAAA